MKLGIRGGAASVETVGVDRPAPGQRLRDLARLCRPRQWAKNTFVLAPLVFSQRLIHVESVLAGLLAFACFCLWSSAVYCLNDTLDAETDASHPKKRNRPIPSGRIAPLAAVTLAGVLVLFIALNLANIAGLPFAIQLCIKGVIIIAASAAHSWLGRRGGARSND